jgi:hypothetical protein
LQIEGKLAQALEYYVKEYAAALESGDKYLSGLLIDEVTQTLLLIHSGRVAGKSGEKIVSEQNALKFVDSELHEALYKVIDPILSKDLDEDIEVEMRKRFPRAFEDDQE